MARIKTTCTLAPEGIYRRSPVEAEAYVTRANSRFAVTRAPGSKHWGLTHRASGGGVSSLLPVLSRPYTLAELLGVISVWEAHTELDWSALDALDHLGASFTSPPPPAFITALRMLAADALA